MAQNALEEYHNLVAELEPDELSWRDRQVYLESRGYLLRPRYRPGWIASWTSDPTIKPFFAEDFVMAPVSESSQTAQIGLLPLAGPSPPSHGRYQGVRRQARSSEEGCHELHGGEDCLVFFLWGDTKRSSQPLHSSAGHCARSGRSKQVVSRDAFLALRG